MGLSEQREGAEKFDAKKKKRPKDGTLKAPSPRLPGPAPRPSPRLPPALAPPPALHPRPGPLRSSTFSSSMRASSSELTTAVSIGSSSSVRDASDASKRMSFGVNSPVGKSDFWSIESLLRVSVPVLSEHRMSMPASSSTAVRRDTIACRLDRRSAPIAIVTESTVGIAIGMPPTISTTMLVSVGHPSAPPVHSSGP